MVADEVAGSGLTLADVQRVLQELLEQGVPIRDMVRICEVLSERASMTKDTETLVEAVRSVLGPAIAAGYVEGGVLAAIALDPLLEHELLDAVRMADGGGTALALEPKRLGDLVDAIAAEARRADQLGRRAVLLCSARLRPSLQRLVGGAPARLPVLAYQELGPSTNIENLGVVQLDYAAV